MASRVDSVDDFWARLQVCPQDRQQQMWGEKLYPLIAKLIQPELPSLVERVRHSEPAGIITGMLLEMDRHELMQVIKSPDFVRAKVEEAIRVREQHLPPMSPPPPSSQPPPRAPPPYLPLQPPPPVVQPVAAGGRLFAVGGIPQYQRP